MFGGHGDFWGARQGGGPIWSSPMRPRCRGGFVDARLWFWQGDGGDLTRDPVVPRGGPRSTTPSPPLPGFFSAPSRSASASPSPRGALSPHVMLAAPRGFPAPGSGPSAPGRGGGGRFGGAEPSPCTTGASPPATSCPVGAVGGSPVLPWVAGRPFAVSFRRFLGRCGAEAGSVLPERGESGLRFGGICQQTPPRTPPRRCPGAGGGEAEGGSGHRRRK